MWLRFTRSFQRPVFFAQQEASRRGVSEVPPEYLLLGLLQEQDAAATRILDRLGVPRAHLRADMERLLAPHGRCCEVQRLTPAALKAVDLASDEARQLGDDALGAEHLLLGLLAEGESLAAGVLARRGASLEGARQVIFHQRK